MNHYNIVLSTELLDDQDYSAVLTTLCKRCERLRGSRSSLSLGDPGSHLVSIVKPVADLESDEASCVRGDMLWSEVAPQQTLTDVITCRVPVAEEQSECSNVLLIQQLHKLAENIPKIGAFLDIFWLVRDETLPSIEENIELYGSLKQLLEWNNAYFNFVTLTLEVEVTNIAEPWVSILRGHVTTIHDLDLCESECLWRGAIHIVGSDIPKGIVLPGFELAHVIQNDEDPELEKLLANMGQTIENSQSCSAPHDDLSRLLSNKIEVIAQVDRQEIPLLYYTGHHCTLRMNSGSKLVDKSRQFIQRLEDNPRLCYLVKLCYGTSWRCQEDESMYKDKHSREKKSWVDYIQESVDHALTCPIQPELDGELGQHVLVLCASGDEDSGDLSCEAHLLRKPSSINGACSHQMAVSALWSLQRSDEGREDIKKKAEGLLSDLPYFTRAQLLHLQQSIKTAQISVLRAWIDEQMSEGESTQISQSKLLSLLCTAQAGVIKDVHSSDVLHHQKPSLEEPDETAVEKACAPPVRDLERLVLVYHSEAENRFSRHKSNESLAGLSPPQRGKVVTLNATEFLKFFEGDGTAAKDCDMELVIKKSSMCKRLTKCTVSEVKMTEWPKSESLQFHDIYYNQGMMEAIEAKSRRLLSRFLTTETSSTCIYRQTHSPTILTISTDQGQGQQQGEGRNEGEGHVNKVSPERVTRSAAGKRKVADEAIKKDSKRLYAARKMLAESRANMKTGADTKHSITAKPHPAPRPSSQPTGTKPADITEAESEAARRASRSQRHKRKLEEIVKETLRGQEITKDNPLFRPCATRLYNLVKSFVKDLTSSVGLRQEMERIAHENVQMVITFESKNRPAKKT